MVMMEPSQGFERGSIPRHSILVFPLFRIEPVLIEAIISIVRFGTTKFTIILPSVSLAINRDPFHW